MIDSDYLSTAATAKLVRVALRDAFPGVVFSVRSHVYAGGSAIRVGWTDGPSSQDVDAVVGGFASRGFDGSIDMSFPISAVVDRDGRIVGHKSPGSSGSLGYVAPVNDPVPDGGRVVHFGASYVTTDRDLSPDVAARAKALIVRVGWSDIYAAGQHNYDRAVSAVLSSSDDAGAMTAFGILASA